MNFSKQNIALCLITIGTISIILKISLVDFSLPVVNNDQLFSESPRKRNYSNSLENIRFNKENGRYFCKESYPNQFRLINTTKYKKTIK